MAEARQAVGFRLTVTHDGHLDLDYDAGAEVLRLIIESGKRTYKKKLARLINALKNALFPVGLEVLAGGVVLLTSLHLAGVEIAILKTILDYLTGRGYVWAVALLLSAFLTAILAVVFVRFLLRQLFSFQGWMYLDRRQARNPPLYIKAWFLLVKGLTRLGIIGHEWKPGHPMLHSYQGALPSQPVPKIKDTLDRHMRSMRPLLNDADYEEMQELANEFETGLAPKLQRYLWLKWIWSDNYVSDWWEEYVYLRGRSPLMINSNYYGTDAMFRNPQAKQSARAANLVHASFSFRRIIQKQMTSPLLLRNTIPLCSRQYDRMFNTTRVPGIEGDKLVHLSDSTHVAVLHKGRFFRMACYAKGRLLEPAELQAQIESILCDDSPPDAGEMNLASMTASERDEWARTRNEHFSSGVNRASLAKIESAAFVLILDDYEYDHDESDPEPLNEYSRLMMHGRGNDRWFDKSFCLIVGTNGRMGINVEHSWADAPVMGHFSEYTLHHDVQLGYATSGDCRVTNGVDTFKNPPPRPTRLRWDFSDEVRGIFDKALRDAKKLIDDLDLYVLCHDSFGKGALKKIGISPDAFAQMAFQVAYLRSFGKFCLTYESAMTRLFREGRTETVRPCTAQATDFARAMDDQIKSKSDKIALLKTAEAAHLRQVQDCMTGKGVDRHLFCLYVVSRYLEIESPFLKKVLSEPWRLSTSQTAVRGEYIDVNKTPEMSSVGGGFGPVVDDGYGVSYLFIGDERIFMHISCKKSNHKTDSKKFAMEIKKAFADMKALFEE